MYLVACVSWDPTLVLSRLVLLDCPKKWPWGVFAWICLISSAHRWISAWNIVVSLLRLTGSITSICCNYIPAPTPSTALEPYVYQYEPAFTGGRGSFFEFSLVGSTTVHFLLKIYLGIIESLDTPVIRSVLSSFTIFWYTVPCSWGRELKEG